MTRSALLRTANLVARRNSMSGVSERASDAITPGNLSSASKDELIVALRRREPSNDPALAPELRAKRATKPRCSSIVHWDM